MFKDELPSAVYQELDRRGLNGVPILLCTTSELSLSGRPERNWIVATRNNVAAVREVTAMRGSPDPPSAADHRSPNPLNPETSGRASAASGDPHTTPIVETHVPVSEVREFRTQSTVGSGFLQAYVDDYWVDLARFPNTEADRFSRLARYLEDLRTEGEVHVETDAAPKVTHCSKCGQRLPVANESCPRCIPRKAILGRLAQMLWPLPRDRFHHVRADAGRRRCRADAAQAAAIPGRPHPPRRPEHARSATTCSLLCLPSSRRWPSRASRSAP